MAMAMTMTMTMTARDRRDLSVMLELELARMVMLTSGQLRMESAAVEALAVGRTVDGEPAAAAAAAAAMMGAATSLRLFPSGECERDGFTSTLSKGRWTKPTR